ncbi:hypothetical protein [Mastigocoleus testarum]|uniref:Uncharacterized protein n=1 Tax=Mastigocoleus testarum BC008 TaxID=371196 RepID=A0A0V7ZHQ5_9CYAN|nr:hypothetical protein [Mastigocoleus testarum]KST63884.1 hypothetical protein BC008_15635 [Mastigocoleus testarum BC008]KST64219.1 hypothetical protein BC008_16410 [Mastigocoleus testarum BC008]
MPTNLILLTAALISAWFIFRALINVFKTFLSTAVAVFVIIILLNAFGFTPEDLIREITNLPETLGNFIEQVRTQLSL